MIKKKKIGFVIFSMSPGGAERVVAILCNRLCSVFDVFLFLVSTKTKSAYSINNEVHIQYLSESKRISPFKKIRTLKGYCKQNRIDVLIAFLNPCVFYAAAVGKILKIPVISSERNNPKTDPRGFALRVLRCLAYRLSTRIVFQTKDALLFFSRSIREKGVIIPNPVSPSFSSVVRECTNQKDVILFVGRFQKQKNITLLLSAFEIFHKTHPSFSLILVGDSCGSNYQNQIRSLTCADSIKVMGTTTDVGKYLTNSKIYALSSDYEGIPNSLLEALCAGVPCVATDCPCGGPKVLMDSNPGGILVRVGDSLSFAEALSKIADNYPHYFEQAICFKNVINEKYSVDSIAFLWKDLIESVAS